MSKRESNKTVEYIRTIDESVSSIKLSCITIKKSRNVAVFDFINNKVVDDGVIAKIEKAISDVIPQGYEFTVHVRKVVAAPDLVAESIYNFLKDKYKAILFNVPKDSVIVDVCGDVINYTLSLSADMCDYFTRNDVLAAIEDYLYDYYCEDVRGQLKNIGNIQTDTEKTTITDDDYYDFDTVDIRYLTVKDPVKIWGEETGDRAVYIADSELVSGEVCFAGTVTQRLEKTAKNGKPFYVIELDDTTGKISGKIFHTKERENKMDKIQIGTHLIVRGNLELFNNSPSFLIDDVSYCEFPADFVPKERKGKPAPRNYTLVQPTPIVEVKQADLFGAKKEIPACLIGKTFVVVDIETTGVTFLSGDRITEVGAVRIKDGEIVDMFQTLVNPEVTISEKITELTGITNEMVKDAPTFDKIIGDLYKYCDGSVIIAHNIEFDYNFIKYMSRTSGFVFKNPGIDTLALAKEVVPGLKNYKLNTVCKHFEIEFLHHRALSDAHATAKMFLELIAIKKSLPD